jgi:hypothetical protein
MIGNWIKRKIQLAAVKGGTEDLERFVTSLQGQSREELGMLVALATLLRINLRNEGHLPDEALGIGMPLGSGTEAQVQYKISQFVRLFQKEGQLTDAAGAMVWLHTLRAFSYPELRILGRKMWGELQRGFEYADDGLDQIKALTGRAIPVEARMIYAFVPPGMEAL